jgi:hypothetical protein
MTARVVLVRAARDAPTGGGCCSGDVRPFDEGGTHAHAPPRDGTAAVYRALRETLPADVSIEVTSPSNWWWLVPALTGDGRRRGLRGRALRRSVLSGLAPPSLVVDGRVLFSGGLPEPAEALAATRAELALL